uniref:Uncharacterized protein n=1 Tax=Aegilops tauschii subsp. strangulata TaxID=200361 RepID=A0A453I3X5_AEGTS
FLPSPAPSLHSRRSQVRPPLPFVTIASASFAATNLPPLHVESGCGSGRGGPRARHACASSRLRRRRTRRRGTCTPLLCPTPSNPVAELLEEALELGVLTSDVGPLPPPDALTVAAMSLSTLSRAIVRVQLAGLCSDDMIAVNNMGCLCAHETKKSSKGSLPMKFEIC